MSIRKELINLTIVNNSDCSLTIPLFQNNVASINATTKYSWDITTADLSCGFGSIIINSITYNITFDTTLTGLLSSLNGLNFGYFCSEIILGQLYVYTIDDTNIYGDLDLCPTPTTTTTSTSTSTTSTSTTSTSTSTSTTSTSTSTTTTTTTLVGECYSIENTDAVDISASYTDVNGNPACQAVPVVTTVYICVQTGTGGSIVLFLGTGCLSGSGSGIITSLGTICTTSGNCIPTTTTTTTTTTSTSTSTTTDIPTTTTTTSTSTSTTTDIPTTTTTTSTSTSTTTDIPTTTTSTTTSTTTILYDIYTAEKYECASCTIFASPVLVALPSGSTPNFGNYYVPSIGSGEQGLYSYVLLASSVGAGLILENQSYVLCADACNV